MYKIFSRIKDVVNLWILKTKVLYMNSSILVSIISLIVLILYRLGKGDLFFFTRPDIYSVMGISLLSYFVYKKTSSNNILILQLILSILIPSYFMISRGY